MTAPNDAFPDPPPTLVVWDAAAYRRLAAAAGDDPVAASALAREAATALGPDEPVPAASPPTLWALLADLAPRAGRAGGRAHAALAACVAHTADPTATGTTATGAAAVSAGVAPGDTRTARARSGASMPAAILRLAPDPELTLTTVALGRTPAQHPAWAAYLASLAVDAAAALLVTPGGARRLAGPLAHVQERAAQQVADLEDEIQDAVLAAYEAGAGAAGWDDQTGADERQAVVAAGRTALVHAVAAGRATRAAALATQSADQRHDDQDANTGLFDPAVLTVAAGRVRDAFAPGAALWAALVGEVVAGRVQPAGRGWRGALWGLQAAFVVGADAADGRVARVVTGSNLVRAAAARAGVAAVGPE